MIRRQIQQNRANGLLFVSIPRNIGYDADEFVIIKKDDTRES